MPRVYVPGGFGRVEVAGLRRLSRKSLSIIAPELSDPGSRATVLEILRSKDPERALAEQIARETLAAMESVRATHAAGLSDYDGERIATEVGVGGLKKAFKKIRKKVSEVHKKVAAKIIPKAIRKPIEKVKEKLKETHKKIQEKVQKGVKKVWKKYGNVIITLAGAVLAPFTGGASLVAASALTAANTMYQKKREADRIKQINKREADRLNAEVAKEEAKLKADLDKLYAENKPVFAAAGITAAAWARLTVDQKLAVVEQINKGNMPASQAAVNEQAEEQGVPPTAAPSVPDWMGAIQSASIYRQALASAPTPAPGGEAPEGEAPAEAPGDVAPAGKYELAVEGEKVFETGDSNELFDTIGQKTKEGDRFEVFLNGKSLGLKIRTAGGVISVPPEAVEKVRAMTHGEVRSMVARAAAAAKGEGEPEEAAGGIPWWLVVGGAAAAIAAAA
ncbi:MAG: hypothetical protein ACREDF_11105 [Thermoplasmata archaeon]